MTTMFRVTTALTLLLLVACQGDRSDGSAGEIRNVAISSLSTSNWKGPADHTLTIEFTLPDDLRIRNFGGLTMTDTAGRNYPVTEASLSESDGVRRVKITAKGLAQDSRAGVVHFPDFDVDIGSQRVTLRAATP